MDGKSGLGARAVTIAALLLGACSGGGGTPAMDGGPDGQPTDGAGADGAVDGDGAASDGAGGDGSDGAGDASDGGGDGSIDADDPDTDATGADAGDGLADVLDVADAPVGGDAADGDALGDAAEGAGDADPDAADGQAPDGLDAEAGEVDGGETEGDTCPSCPSGCGSCPVCGDGSCDDDEGCHSCPEDCGACTGDCCSSNGSMGCESEACTAAVCEHDAFCCKAAWDTSCGRCARGGRTVTGEDCPLDMATTCDCEPIPPCGNGLCAEDEDCESCPEDCGECPPECGDGTCEGDEDCSSCSVDCGECESECGNGDCEDGEDCDSCPEDCGECGPECGDGLCEGSESCSSCPSDCGECVAGSCCSPNDGAGCNDAECEDAVCAKDSFCCDTTWDSTCVDCANGENTFAASCSDGVGETCGCDGDDGGGGGGGGGEGDCCSANGTPGCDSQGCADFVCSSMPSCCDDEWTSDCVACAQGNPPCPPFGGFACSCGGPGFP